VNGSCTFNVRVCLNQADPALPTCTASGVDEFEVRGSSSDPQLAQLEANVAVFLPATTGDVCTVDTPMTVPLGGTTDHPLNGRKRIRSVARSFSSGKDVDSVELLCTPPPRPLGTRHFVVKSSNSPFFAVIGTLSLPAGNFQGFLDLEAGTPDANGFAPINVPSASEYISANIQLAGMILCLKPHVPATNVGLVACKGLDISYAASVDHVAGTVGQNGFTVDDCTAIRGSLGNGTVEYGRCADNDDNETAQQCLANTDCTAPLTCQTHLSTPHTGVCNGPINVGPGGKGDSGRGAVAITPDPDTGQGGLVFDLSFVHPGKCRNDESVDCSSNTDCGGDVCEQACGDTEPTTVSALPFFSGPVSVQIFHADAGTTNRKYETKGENFSCADWTNPNGPGKLVFAIPQLHAFALSAGQSPSDLITAWVLSGR